MMGLGRRELEGLEGKGMGAAFSVPVVIVVVFHRDAWGISTCMRRFGYVATCLHMHCLILPCLLLVQKIGHEFRFLAEWKQVVPICFLPTSGISSFMSPKSEKNNNAAPTSDSHGAYPSLRDIS